jgi:hypothetical protein
MALRRQPAHDEVSVLAVVFDDEDLQSVTDRRRPTSRWPNGR